MPDTTTRIGIIGTTNLAAQHLGVYAKSAAVSVAGVVLTDAPPAAPRDLVTQAPLLSSIDDLLGVSNLDLLDVCMTEALSHRWVWGVPRSRIPMLLVAPPASEAGAADGFLPRLKKSKSSAAVTHTLRFDSACARVKEIVESGVLGDVQEIHVTYPGKLEGSPGENSPTRFQAVDLCCWLADATPAAAHLADEDRAVRLTFVDGRSAGIMPQTSGAGWNIVVLGTTATLTGVLRSGQNQLAIEWPGRTKTISIPDSDPLQNELTYYVGAVAHGEPWLISSLADTQDSLLAYEMARAATGRLPGNPMPPAVALPLQDDRVSAGNRRA